MKFVPSPYFSDRGKYKPEGVVIHTTVGFYEGTIKYFQKNDRQVSAHYVVSLNGDVTQMVQLDKAAHHAGITSNPTTSLYKKGVNPNAYTIGIENADDHNPAGADRSKQLPELCKLVAELCTKFDISADRDHIVGHREFYDKKTCPGNIDLVKVVSGVRDILNSNDMPVWLNGLLQENGIDESKAEPWFREALGKAKERDSAIKERDKANIERAGAEGRAAELETVLITTNKNLKRTTDDLDGCREDGLAKDAEIAELKRKLEVPTTPPINQPGALQRLWDLLFGWFRK